MRTSTRVLSHVATGLALSVLVQVDLAAQRGSGGQGVAPAAREELSESYRGSQRQNIEYQRVAPIKVFDNLASWNLWVRQVQAGAAKNLEEERLKATR